MILFLQTWRAAIIPLIAIPVSLIGSFFFLATFGFSLNNLSLFGLVLAIGIVVDDAIVVVENVERNIASGLSPRDAARKSMDEVGSALVAIALVLCAVFVPSMFITGISGQFYRQFALTIAGADRHLADRLADPVAGDVRAAAQAARYAATATPGGSGRSTASSRYFNFGFDKLAYGISWLASKTVRRVVMMVAIYLVVLAVGLNTFRTTPTGFIPQVDRGYLITVVQLPPGASLARTDEVQQRALDIALSVPGVAHAVNIVGFSGATFTNAPNAGALFLVLDPFEKRAKDPRQSAAGIQAELFKRLSVIQDAFIITVLPPPVAGIGNAGGFRMMVEDRAGQGSEALKQATLGLMARAAQTPGVAGVFSLFETSTPQVYLNIDRTKAQLLGINVTDVFNALQIYIGSLYVNDFNLFGRTFRVTAQARDEDRKTVEDVLKIRVRNSSGDTVPLGSFTTVDNISGPYRVPRYNLYPTAELDGAAAPRLFAGPGDRDHGQARGRDLAGRFRHRMDDARLPADPRRLDRDVRLPPGGGVRLPRAGGAV